jgi:hypothetical protein
MLKTEGMLKMRQLEPRPRPRALPRGSVLIFAIAILAILAMLGTAFLLVVRQSGTASVSVLSNQQADIAARSGVENALRAIRSNVLRYTICTDSAVFEPANSGFTAMPVTDLDLINNTAPVISPLMQFRGLDSTKTRAMLGLVDYNGDVYSYTGPHFTSEMFGAARLPMGTRIHTPPSIAPGLATITPDSMFHIYVGTELIIDTAPNDEAVVVTNITDTTFDATFTKSHTDTGGGIGVGIMEFARQNLVTGSVSDFYLPAPSLKIKEMGHLNAASPRGEYYVWVADLDSRLYAVPQDWGVDNTNTSYTMAVPTLRQNVLKSLGVFSAGDISFIDGATASNTTGDLRYPTYRNNSELALDLPSTNGTSPSPAYEQARNLLDIYISPYKDTAEFNLPLNLKFCKDWSTAININTASIEVITAALSQIPSEDRQDTVNSPPNTVPLEKNVPVAGGRSMAYYLAKRIIEKRPFLCRMDFEDFLAAQIMGTAGYWGDLQDRSNSANPMDIPADLIGTGPNPMWVNDPTYWNDPSTPPPVAHLLYFTIGRRLGPGNTTFAIPPTAATDPEFNTYQWFQTNLANFFTKPELSLSQYLEIPGVPDSPAPKMFTLPSTTYTANTPAFQKARFRYFFGSPIERDRIVNVEQSLITTKEFNNIINSVTSIFVNDDVQAAFPGDTVAVGATVVTAGPDGQMSTTPQGDDVYDNPAAPTLIKTTTTVAKTWTSLNRPSYYSYFNDTSLTDPIWNSIADGIDAFAHANPSGPSAFYDATEVLATGMSTVPLTAPYAPQTISEALGFSNPTSHNSPLFQTKYFYLFRVIPGVAKATDTTPGWLAPRLDDLLVTDMLFCRCRPYNSAPNLNTPDATGTAGRAGFYQICFDDWTSTSAATAYPGSLGFVQTSGDPDDSTNLYSTANINSGVPKGPSNITNGDVSWSPQFGFRSRYYGIYVLGRGLLQGASPQIRDLGERRIEAVYDALKDEVLWQRSQLSDKRSLGD